MQSSELTKGRLYAWCESPLGVSPGFVRVRFRGPARAGKAKILWEEGDLRGLEEWVSTRQLLCPWGERLALLRDRRRQADLERDSDEILDPVVERAISLVLTATGEERGFDRTWTPRVGKAQRLWQRAGLPGDPRDEPLAFVDRNGRLHLGYASALKFAMAFAASDPESCVHLIERSESKLRAEGYLPGSRSHHEVLRQAGPAYALVRQWAGEPEVVLLRSEITRLQGLVSQAVRELRAAGNEQGASSLERGLRGQ